MVEIEKPRIECIDSQDDVSYGKYIVEPLERGYGTTLGNSLRRILLSSLPGRDLHQDRGRAARVLHGPRRQGRRHGDRAEREEDHCEAPLPGHQDRLY